MSVGERVFAACPVYHAGSDPKGIVTEGTVVAIGDRGETVVKTEHGIYTYGSPFSDSKVFLAEAEAWRYCGEVLRQRAEAVAVAAKDCLTRAGCLHATLA